MDRRTAGTDLMAGLTGAIIMIPQGIAFATIAGMPPVYGLYAGMVPVIIAALFGSSWHLVTGPTTAGSILVLATISDFAEPGTGEFVALVLTLTLMVGLIELAMGFMRMGVLVNFVSHTVAIGFMAGAAILIAASQMSDFFGIAVPRGLQFYEVLMVLGRNIDQISPATTAVGLATVASGILFKKLLPRIPYMILPMVVGGALAAILNGYFGAAVPTIAPIEAGLPPISVPVLSVDLVRDLAPAALAFALFALTEAISISRALAVRSGQQIDGNQEFIGQGLSNICGCFFSGFVVTGSFNRSALNYDAGAKTPLATISSGFMLMALTPLVVPLATYLPKATIAGILFLVVYSLIDIPNIRQIVRSSRREAIVMAVTFFSVVFVNLEVAIFAGVILSLLFYLNRTSHPNVTTLAPNPADPRRRFSTDRALPECPQIKIVRIDGSLFFGAVSNVVSQLRRLERSQPTQVHLLIIASGINFIDIEGAEALAREARRHQANGGQLYLVGAKESVVMDLERTGALDAIGHDNLFATKTVALGEIYKRLNMEICEACSKRIFRECHGKTMELAPKAEEAPAPHPPTPHPPAPAPEPAAPPPPPPAPAPVPAPAPAPAPAAAKAPIGAPSPKGRRQRVLALIDFDAGPQSTAAEAWQLAQELDADIALGQVVKWKWGSGRDFPAGFVTEAMENSLCAPARSHLGEIAQELGIEAPALLASASPDTARGAQELLAEWIPDIVVVHERSSYHMAGRRNITFDTHFGSRRSKIHTAHGADPENGEEGAAA